MMPLLCWHLEAACWEAVPESVRDELHNHLLGTMRLNLALTGELLKLLRLLEFVTVNGGKYSFNGLDRDVGTGYGVACFQQPIGSEAQEVIMQGIVSHDNYRKGLDAHAGRRLIFAHNEMYRNKLYGLMATAQNAGSGFLLGEP